MFGNNGEKKTYLRNELKKPTHNIIRQVPNTLAQVLCLFLKKRDTDKHDGWNYRGSKEGTGGELGYWRWNWITMCVLLYGSKKHKAQVRKGIRKAQSSL